MRNYRYKILTIILGDDGNYYFLMGSDVDYRSWDKSRGYQFFWDNLAVMVELENMKQSVEIAEILFNVYVYGVTDGSISTYRLD